MATGKAPTVIVIPGSWHTAHHATPLIEALKAKGHNAQAHQLASVGLKEPRPTFADDVNVVVNAVTNELDAGRDVCLVLHSYAGMPGAEAVNRLVSDGRLHAKDGQARLRNVVFVAAYAFPAGFVMDAKMFVGSGDPNFTIDDNEMNVMTNARDVFFNDIPDDAEAQSWVAKLAPAYYLGKDPVLSSEEWKKSPITVMLTRQDNAIPPARQEMVWQGFEQDWVDGSHTPYVSQPGIVADVIVAAIAKKVAL